MSGQICSSFTLFGTKLSDDSYYTVTVKGSVVVLEFLNNAQFVMVMKEQRRGYGLWFRDVLLLDGIELSDKIDLSFNHGWNSIDADFKMECAEQSVAVRVVTYGEVTIWKHSIHNFSEGLVFDWRMKNGVKQIVGATRSSAQGASIFGYEVTWSMKRVLVTFKNGFKFPVLRRDNGIELVREFHKIGRYLDCVYLRVWETDETYVHFRLTFVSHDCVVVCDDIWYNSEEVKYLGECIPTSKVTKQLLVWG